MKKLIFIISLITSVSQAEVAAKGPRIFVNYGAPVVIAIIDTGLGFSEQSLKAPLCKYGHKDFSGQDKLVSIPGIKDKVPLDTHGHGSNIAGIISIYANLSDVNYCLVIIKNFPSANPLEAEINAINYATNIGVKILNISAGGLEESVEESAAVKKFLDRGGILLAAAGNEKTELTKTERHYFPAQSDPRVIVVGNLSLKLKKSPLSNYGNSVTRWEYGENVEGFGLSMTGTSQATAVATGKILGEAKIIYDRPKKTVALRN